MLFAISRHFRATDTIFVEQRPYSRRSIAHMLNEAERSRTRLDAIPSGAPFRLSLLARGAGLVPVGFEYRP